MTNETKILIGILAATILLIVGGAFIAGRNNSAETGPVTETERLVRDGDPILGPADARVTVVEFGDFQCPACGALHPVLKQVKANNADSSVRFVYRQFPLTQIHEHAALAAEASLAAGAQGKFWEYHDRLFENQSKLTRDDLINHARELGLDVDRFTRELDDHTHVSAVQQGISDGTALGVQGTPTLFINGVPFRSQYSVAALQEAIDEALQ